MESVAIYPRLLRRVRAVLIDFVIAVLIVFCWFLLLPLMVDIPGPLKFSFLAFAWFVLDPLLVWRVGCTPGHYFMKLRIQHKASGANIGLLRAVIRSLFKAVTGVWSFILVLATKKHQALHDLLSNTTVVLKNPATVPEWERNKERLQDQGAYTYPSALRKCLVIFSYVVFFSLAFFALVGLFFSNECFLQNSCSEGEKIALMSLDWVWFFGIAILVVYGWRSRLFGARRQPREHGEHGEATGTS